MGLFCTLFGSNRHDKFVLIKDLAKSRVDKDPMARARGTTPSTIDKMNQTMLLSLPEATIASIVETYAAYKPQGLHDAEIFEAHETEHPINGAATKPRPLTLTNYVKYRIAVEHGHDAPISEYFIEHEIQKSLEFFSV